MNLRFSETESAFDYMVATREYLVNTAANRSLSTTIVMRFFMSASVMRKLND